MFKNNIITSAFVSTATVLLAMVFLPSFLNVENERAGDGTHQPVQSLFVDANQDDDSLITLQIRIEELLEKHQALIEQGWRMEERVAQLESTWFQKADNPVHTAGTQAMNESVLSIDQEERDMALASEAFSENFENLADQMFHEEYDSAWASEMESSFAEVEQRLQDFNPGSTIITSTECRSRSCMVEFTHQENTDQALIASLLPARGAKEVVLKHVQEGNTSRTLAIYLR